MPAPGERCGGRRAARTASAGLTTVALLSGLLPDAAAIPSPPEKHAPAGSFALASSGACSDETGFKFGSAPYKSTFSFDALGRLVQARDLHGVVPAGGGAVTTQTADLVLSYSGASPRPAHGPSSVAGHPAGTITLGYAADGSGKAVSLGQGGSSRTLGYDWAQRVASVARSGSGGSAPGAAGTSAQFSYTADGDLWRRVDASGTTYYLGADQVLVPAGGGTALVTRTYAAAGTAVAVRTTTAGSASAGSWITGDVQGSPAAQVDWSTGAVVFRLADPTGQVRTGAALPTSPQAGAGTVVAAGGAWLAGFANLPGQRGFLGKVEDPTSDLALLGARTYDPSLGIFLQPDPLSAPGSIESLSAFLYASGNPVAFADPSGLWPDISIDLGSVLKVVATVAVAVAATAAVAAVCATGVGCLVLAGVAAGAASGAAGNLLDVATGDRDFDAASLAKDTLIGGTIGGLTAGAGGLLAAGAERAAATTLGGNITAKITQAKGILTRGGTTEPRTAAAMCSFAGSTLVLMADGSQRPIDQIQVGDQVIASDPETGTQRAETVQEVFVHDDTLTELIVDGQVLTTTEDHPFWSVTDSQFERADQLAPGELVLTADGRTLPVSGLEARTAHPGTAYNLAIAKIHTYHAGNDALLVHNTCPLGGRGGAAPVRMGQEGEAAVRASNHIGPKFATSVNGRRRIFDGLTADAVTEVKNVAYQAFTRQIKDSLAYAEKEGIFFDLYVRAGATRLSRPLQDAISANARFRLKEIM